MLLYVFPLSHFLYMTHKFVFCHQPATQDAPAADAPAAQETAETKPEPAKEAPVKGPNFISKVFSTIKEKVNIPKSKKVGYAFDFLFIHLFLFFFLLGRAGRTEAC
jgi:hypothetical protein